MCSQFCSNKYNRVRYFFTLTPLLRLWTHFSSMAQSMASVSHPLLLTQLASPHPNLHSFTWLGLQAQFFGFEPLASATHVFIYKTFFGLHCLDVLFFPTEGTVYTIKYLYFNYFREIRVNVVEK